MGVDLRRGDVLVAEQVLQGQPDLEPSPTRRRDDVFAAIALTWPVELFILRLFDKVSSALSFASDFVPILMFGVNTCEA